jgi:hypothetical protein
LKKFDTDEKITQNNPNYKHKDTYTNQKTKSTKNSRKTTQNKRQPRPKTVATNEPRKVQVPQLSSWKLPKGESSQNVRNST